MISRASVLIVGLIFLAVAVSGTNSGLLPGPGRRGHTVVISLAEQPTEFIVAAILYFAFAACCFAIFAWVSYLRRQEVKAQQRFFRQRELIEPEKR